MCNLAPVIKGKNVLLRKPKESDITDYYQVQTSGELIRMYGENYKELPPKTMEQAKEFIRSIWAGECEWCIEFEGRLIGQARLTINKRDKRARYAVGLFDPAVWGYGLGTEATLLVLRYAFKEMGLHRVDLRVLEYNKRAIRCYEKCGFVEEGREREGALIEGKFETDVIMSILDREYDKLIEVNGY